MLAAVGALIVAAFLLFLGSIRWAFFSLNQLWDLALMYVLVPMPYLFFGGGSTQFLISRDDGGWTDAAKFLTGASAVGSMYIPIILRHAGLIGTGPMIIDFTSFFILMCTVLCFRCASLLDEWQPIIPMKKYVSYYLHPVITRVKLLSIDLSMAVQPRTEFTLINFRE